MYVVVALVVGFGAGIGYALAFVDGGEAAPASVAETASDAALSEPAPALSIAVEGRPFLGDPESPVTVIEMTDYECPFCRRHHQQVLEPLLAEYGDRIRYVAINFPLTSIHPLAFGAAEGAECAHDQGRFWDYSEALFASNESLVPDVLVAIAAGVGLDVPVFTECLNSATKRELVIQDIGDGQKHGVTGTPTFFINGKRLAGARPLEIFRQAIDAELAAIGDRPRTADPSP